MWQMFDIVVGWFEIVVGWFYDFPFYDCYFVGRPFNALTALCCGLLRCMPGQFIAKGVDECARPQKRLKLYEFEACPFCRKVREALCVLDLDVEVFPCPKPALVGKCGVADKSSRYRSEVAQTDGKTLFPVLIDDNRGGIIRGSEEIVSHLWNTYGSKASPPFNYQCARIMDKFLPLFFLPGLLRIRPSHGIVKLPSRAPAKSLILWGHEPSPFVKIVREALCSLELPYTYITTPIGSCKRQEFLKKYSNQMSQKIIRKVTGTIQVPMLIDPNCSEEALFESAVIVKYLHDTYGLAAVKGD